MAEHDPFFAAISAVVTAAQDCVICIDDEGRVSEWNPAAERTFGWRRSEALGCDLAELIIPPELREAHRAGRERYRRTREAHVLGRRVELPALRRDGEVFPVELTITEVESPSGTFFIAYLRDLSVQKRNESRRTAQYRLASLLAGAERLDEIASEILQIFATVGNWQVGTIWLIDADDSTVVARHVWSADPQSFAAFEAVTRQCRLQRGQGFPGRIFASGEPEWIRDAAIDEPFIRRNEAAAEGLHGGFGFPICATGRAIGVVELFSREALEPDEDLVALSSAIGRNIGQFIQREAAIAAQETHLKKVEEQRQIAHEARQNAEAANKAKDRFIAMLSHELRTPLTPMLLWASADLESDPVRLREGLQMIRANVELEARLIDDLLDYSRLAYGKLRLIRTTCDVHQLLREVADMLRANLAQRELVWNLRADKVKVVGDPIRLKQVFWNLLRNAATFTPTDGRITVATDSAPDTLEITVTDTGEGIAPEAIQKIFDPFEQGERESRGGLGLGLAIARSLVALHEGQLNAASQGLGRGASFQILLPCCVEEAEKDAARGEVVAKAVKPWRILIVEDHESTRRTLAALLKRAGHTVIEATTVAEAKEHLKAGAFDLLMTDLGLPDGNGASLTRDLPPSGRTKAVALSGYGEEQDIRNSEIAGFARHLTKPIDFNLVKAVIAELQNER